MFVCLSRLFKTSVLVRTFFCLQGKNTKWLITEWSYWLDGLKPPPAEFQAWLVQELRNLSISWVLLCGNRTGPLQLLSSYHQYDNPSRKTMPLGQWFQNKSPEPAQLGSHTHPGADLCGRENMVLSLASLGHMPKGSVGGVSPFKPRGLRVRERKVILWRRAGVFLPAEDGAEAKSSKCPKQTQIHLAIIRHQYHNNTSDTLHHLSKSC